VFDRIRFAFSYALRNMIRDRRRSAFTLLCVAVGVATVVALRALGLMITDALTSNAQAFLRGDIQVSGQGAAMNISIFNLDTNMGSTFDAEDIARIHAWAADRDMQVTFTHNSELMQVAVVGEDGKAGAPGLSMATFIDPEVYPFYDTIRAEEPRGTPLADLFDETPRQIVLGSRIADETGAQVGDSVRVGQSEDYFTVTGIVPDSAESTLQNFPSLWFGFIYLDRDELPAFGLEDSADRAYLKIAPGDDVNTVMSDVIDDWPEEGMPYFPWRLRNVENELAQNEVIADVIARFVLLLSVVGLVIGGVGIMNTMVVAVNRRSMEIAVLKTLGLQGVDISLVFAAEAILSGLLGSAVGIVLGTALSYIARDFGQQAFTFALPWRIYFDPMVIGTALGVAATAFFSFMPTLMAGRIRPNIVLREDDIPMARAGCLLTLLSFAVLIIGFGLMIDLILGTDRIPIELPPLLTPGIVGTFGVFIALGIVIALLWVVVWLLGKLPSFRSANLRIAIRGLTTHRSRTALSLLALIVGMTSLSGTLIMARSINTLLYTSISGPLGGNIIVLPLPIFSPLVHNNLEDVEAVNGYRVVRFPGRMRLRAIDGDRDFESWFDKEDAQSGFRSAKLDMTLAIDVRGEPRRGTLIEGRYLGPEDAGKNVIQIPYMEELAARGVGVGSTFTYDTREGLQNFEVVGVVQEDAGAGLIPISLADGALQIPPGNISSESMPFDVFIVDAQPDGVKDAMAEVAGIPGVFTFDVSIFDSLISRLLRQMAALPLLVAVLSLFAAVALIATTVALATMERRRQIAIFKALGVSRAQALAQLLIENGIVGVVGGLISLAPTLLILALVPALTQNLVRLPVPTDLILLMMILSVLVTIGATLVTAWGASGERPLNALRYE
jgi:putative ABC transport system permease protein